MEYAVFLGIVVLVLIIFALFGARNERRRRRTFLLRMKENYGKGPQKKYTAENYAHVPKYHEKHRTPCALDDITWNDLDMDYVFARMNYCRSAAGEEMLYHLLRSPDIASESGDEKAFREGFEEKVNFFSENEESRLQSQLLFEDMRQTAKFSVYEHLDMLTKDGMKSNLPHIAALVAIIICFVLSFVFFTPFAPITLALLTFNVITYYKEKNDIAPYLNSFSYVLRLIIGSENLIRLLSQDEFKTVFEKELDEMNLSVRAMKPFTRGASIVIGGAGGANGSPLDLIMDYVKIFTHADLMKFNSMFKQLLNRVSEVDALIRVTGMTECALSVACLRASLENGYCRPEFTSEKDFVIKGGYHVLINNPVKDTVECGKNILITGSNASGKSTFLKMCAINAVCAQTVGTVFADEYRAPYFDIYTSMALSDDIREGESYYMVEIKSLKRILDATANSGRRVLCFIDEVLRGTNTLERISASSQILKSFAGKNIQCFAATHDGELTEILGDIYDNYHFDSEIKDGDVRFTYLLKKGKSETKNALQLLRLMGYDEQVVHDAENMAARFLETGEWRA